MAMKPNYRHERTQRERSREVKKQEKQRRREEASARRKAPQTDDPEAASSGDNAPPADSEKLEPQETPRASEFPDGTTPSAGR